MRDSGMLVLPCERTLRYYKNKIPQETGNFVHDTFMIHITCIIYNFNSN